MEIVIERIRENYDSIFSNVVVELQDSSRFICKAIENKETCISKGDYHIINSYSPKFNRNLWSIINSRGRKGIRIHAANFGRELKGCIALGLLEEDDCIRYSKDAMRIFHEILDRNKKEVYNLKIK